MATHETPQERVAAYLRRVAQNNATYGPGRYQHYDDEFDAFGTGETLRLSDIRDVVDELEQAQSMLEQIDVILDEHVGFNATKRIRRIMGNHTDRRKATS